MGTPPPYVPATEPGAGPGLRVGRFGRKAQVTSLFQQTVVAYQQDMGVTSPALPDENVNPLAPPGLPDPDRAPDPEVNGARSTTSSSTCGCSRPRPRASGRTNAAGERPSSHPPAARPA